MNETKQKRILVPTRCAYDWKSLLAEPDKHWQPGYSAMLTAYAWENAFGLPPEIAKLFNFPGEDRFRGLELVLAIPEYKVSLKGGSRPSQNDVFALLTSEKGLIALTVEGKAREDFGPTLKQWRSEVSDKGYRERLRYVLKNIGLPETIPDNVRYQLLHRTASAVLEAKRFHAKCAVMVVQSFIDSNSKNHFADYARFIALYSKNVIKDKLIFLAEVDEIRLYSAWVHSEVSCSEEMKPE